jgi:glycosyltransferase involved in cell wall biosynthesis
MQDQPELLFLLVGDGKEKERLQGLAIEKQLANVRFEGFVSRDAYPDLLSICSIGLVCLSPQNKTPVVPGKVLGHMAAGIPVAAFLQEASDGFALINEAQCGIVANSADKAACIAALKSLMNQKDRFKEIGAHGHRYASEHLSKEHCVSQLEAMLGTNVAKAV